MANPVQAAWLQLRFDQDFEYTLQEWQEFSARFNRTPLCSYSLWWLASVYNDAFREHMKRGLKEAEVLKNYGVEIAEALSQMSIAPQHLRAQALYLRQQLLYATTSQQADSASPSDQ